MSRCSENCVAAYNAHPKGRSTYTMLERMKEKKKLYEDCDAK